MNQTAFDRLLEIMNRLRNECPWDKKQTTQSLRHLTIEEVYELSDAILKNNVEDVKKELGDILLHIVFYAKIASETNQFTIDDVIHTLCEKLIFRHPHIYGDVQVKDENDVKENWEKLKLKEGNKSVLAGVPNSLPSMIKAQRIQEKAKAVGFDWDNSQQVLEKVKEEIAEFENELEKDDKNKIESEFGDVLFSLINYARFVGINPEDALEKTNLKFISRFNFLEHKIKEDKKEWGELSLNEMEEIWTESKKIYK
jgi:XTP/dITP diphosphohydrolase